ncbi:MAG: hypothetical protein K6F45_07175 [Saccharofermentans sp.]|nr:hypothetical protein [Saccharofermentans sp.]
MDKVRSFLIKSFGVPDPMNWGYPVMFAALGSLLCFVIFRAAYAILPYASTSLLGYSFSSIIFTLIVFAAPAVFLSRRDPVSISGHYTGIGVLLLAFLSGAPLYLIRTALQNVTVFLWMRAGNSVVFPFLFCYTDDHTPIVLALELLTDTVIPAFGAALFFYGIVWSSVRPKDRRLAMIIIPVLYALFTLDLNAFFGALVTGWWLCVLRKNIENIWGPILCLIGSRLTGIIMSTVLAPADITTLITYQDIAVSYFYAAGPAIVVGAILLLFFTKTLGEFNFTYNNSIYGDVLDADFREERDRTCPPALSGFNIALAVGVIIMIVMWVLMVKGVRA